VTVPAQLSPGTLKSMSAGDRGKRMRILATELYDGWCNSVIANDMRVTERTVRRWFKNPDRVPVVVLIAFGAMVAVKRAGLSAKEFA
jgi:hypothetical protein